MVSLAPIAILVVTQMVRWSGSFASLHYGAMRAGAALSSSAESTGPVLQAWSRVCWFRRTIVCWCHSRRPRVRRRPSSLHRATPTRNRFDEIGDHRNMVGHRVRGNRSRDADAAVHSEPDSWIHGHDRLSRPRRPVYCPYHWQHRGVSGPYGSRRSGNILVHAVCTGLHAGTAADTRARQRPRTVWAFDAAAATAVAAGIPRGLSRTRRHRGPMA